MELEQKAKKALFETIGSFHERDKVMSLVQQLKEHDAATYQHSLRVGLLAYKAAQELNYDERDMLISGLLHDIGKISVSADILSKKTSISIKEWLKLENHVEKSHKMLKDDYAFCAEVILRHRSYQQSTYPSGLPETDARTNAYAMLLAAVDFYDAHTHRDDASRKAKGSVQQAMLEEFPGMPGFVNNLFLYGALQVSP